MDARVRLGQLLIGIVAALLVMSAAPLTVAGGGPPADVGDYVRDGTVQDLTAEHVHTGPDRVTVDAPAGTSEIRVDAGYLRDRLGNYAADHAFTDASGSVNVDAEDVTFTAFEPGSDEVFTFGSESSIRFVDRPMWVSVRPIDDGVEISAHDGDIKGQKIRFDTNWLAGFGVFTPVAIHHDGTVLDVEMARDGSSIVVNMPHFSHVVIIDPSLDQSWMDEGFTMYYDATGPHDPFSFRVTVTEVTGERITFTFWESSNGNAETVYQKEFEKVTRERVVQPGYFSFSYINETNLAEEQAKLGTKTFDLELQTVTSWVFTSGTMSYYFDIDDGWLRKVVDDANGAETKISAWGSCGCLPLDDPTGDAHTAVLTTNEGGHVLARFDDIGTTTEATVEHHWTGNDPDETVRANLLSIETEVTAKVHYHLEAQIKTWNPEVFPDDPAPCWDESDCHTQANLEANPYGLRVSGEDDGGYTGGPTIVCSCDNTEHPPLGLTDCVERECEHSSTGELEVTVTVEHGVNDFKNIDFWYCGAAFVWDRNGGRGTDPDDQDILCDIFEPADRSGIITVDARLLPI